MMNAPQPPPDQGPSGQDHLSAADLDPAELRVRERHEQFLQVFLSSLSDSMPLSGPHTASPATTTFSYRPTTASSWPLSQHRNSSSFSLPTQEVGQADESDPLRRLAQQLGWSMAEVEQHAFRYLWALVAYDQEAEEVDDPSSRAMDTTVPTTESGASTTAAGGEEGHSESETTARRPVHHPARPWSRDESILFDTLLALVTTPGENHHHHHHLDRGDWAEWVAPQIPGRSVREIRERYETLLGRASTSSSSSLSSSSNTKETPIATAGTDPQMTAIAKAGEADMVDDVTNTTSTTREIDMEHNVAKDLTTTSSIAAAAGPWTTAPTVNSEATVDVDMMSVEPNVATDKTEAIQEKSDKEQPVQQNGHGQAHSDK